MENLVDKCKHQTVEFKGVQEGMTPQGSLAYADCVNCRATVTLDRNYTVNKHPFYTLTEKNYVEATQ